MTPRDAGSGAEPGPEPEPEPEPRPPQSPGARALPDLVGATALVIQGRGSQLPAGRDVCLYRVAAEAVVRDDWCDPSAAELRVAMPGEMVLGVETRETEAGRQRVRLASGGWVSRVASDGGVLLVEAALPVAFHRTPECSDAEPLAAAASLTIGKRYYLDNGLRVVRTTEGSLLLIADGREPEEVAFSTDASEGVRDEAWQLEPRRVGESDESLMRRSGVAKLKGLGAQAAGAVSKTVESITLYSDAGREGLGADGAEPPPSRLEQLLDHDDAAARTTAAGGLNTSLYPARRRSVLTRELLSSNVGLAPNADDSATVALATDISLGMGGFA